MSPYNGRMFSEVGLKKSCRARFTEGDSHPRLDEVRSRTPESRQGSRPAGGKFQYGIGAGWKAEDSGESEEAD